MDGKEFISADTLQRAYDGIKESLTAMTAQCEKLLALNTQLVAESNEKDAHIAQLTTALDIAQSDNTVLRSANRSLVIALTETAR